MFRFSQIRSAIVLFGLLPAGVLAQNVGIGTVTPQEKLHVAGNLRIDALAGADTRVAGVDPNGTVTEIAAGATGQVLTQGLGGPTWQDNAAWDLLGNAGTAIGTNFIGTTDLQGMAFRINNVERARFTPFGNLTLNSTTPLSSDVFSVYAGPGQYAVNGYSFNGANAGFFYSDGTSAALVGESVGLSGSAAVFQTNSASASNSPTVLLNNVSAVAPALRVQTFVANPAAHGISLDINGASSHRGIQVDMDAASSGVGVAVLQYGSNHSLSLQSFNPAATATAFLSDQASAGRSIAATTYLTTSTTQTGFFNQLSNGIVNPTYSNATALWAQSAGIRGGAFLSAGGSANNTVLQALYNGVAGNYDGIGMYAVFQSNPSYGYGVVGQGNWYGVFANGNSGATGVKSFMIDHPLDPTNKYLRHFSIESPEVLNLYRGTAVLDANGAATVQLPNYFHAVNVNFSYQLTPVGGASVMYVAQEIDPQGQFQIAGGSPGQKVCWNVYADRNDAFVQQNPESVTVEPMKRVADVGLYLQPELAGQPKEAGLFERYKVRPEEVKPEAQLESVRSEQVQPSLKPDIPSGR